VPPGLNCRSCLHVYLKHLSDHSVLLWPDEAISVATAANMNPRRMYVTIIELHWFVVVSKDWFVVVSVHHY
jgi:hypothetical protein